MKRSQPKRLWKEAREKCEEEDGCRVCGAYPTETAHTMGRRYDQPIYPGSQTLRVDPNSVVPLCKEHHLAYDAHAFDLLSYLTDAEQATAVTLAGSLETARRRLYPSAYRDESVTPSPAYHRAEKAA